MNDQYEKITNFKYNWELPPSKKIKNSDSLPNLHREWNIEPLDANKVNFIRKLDLELFAESDNDSCDDCI